MKIFNLFMYVSRIIELESLESYVISFAVTITTSLVLYNIVSSKNFMEFYVYFYG